MNDRYRRSGKAKLVMLFLSDHDPEGWDIAETFAKSMRDDFKIADPLVRQVAAVGAPEATGPVRLQGGGKIHDQ